MLCPNKNTGISNYGQNFVVELRIRICCRRNFFIFLGLDKIEFLQSHVNKEIYQKACEIIGQYFGTEEEDSRVAPTVAPDAQQFQFTDQSVPMGDFQF